MIQQKKETKVGHLKVKVYESRLQMGIESAYDISEKIRELLATQAFVNIIFAAAPSQNEFLSCLTLQKNIAWERVNAFHMDEYIGLDTGNPERFGNFLKERLFGKVPFHKVYYIDGNTSDVEYECRRYENLLQQYPADIACMGIGENGHLAFNDPHVADFKDPHRVKVVNLDEISRQQQVHDGCFAYIDEVPASAITLTMPALLEARFIYCMVPGSSKAEAVYHTLYSEKKESYPSTALRDHPHATLYLDQDSAAKLQGRLS